MPEKKKWRKKKPTSPGFSEALQWCMSLGRSIRIMISKATALSIRTVRLCLPRHQALEETGGLTARGEGFAMRKHSVGQHRALLEAGPWRNSRGAFSSKNVLPSGVRHSWIGNPAVHGHANRFHGKISSKEMGRFFSIAILGLTDGRYSYGKFPPASFPHGSFTRTHRHRTAIMSMAISGT